MYTVALIYVANAEKRRCCAEVSCAGLSVSVASDSRGN